MNGGEPEPADEAPLLCHRCGRSLRPGKGELYVVRIEAVADPYPPDLDETELGEDLEGRIASLIGEFENVSERELMDQVHRRFTLQLCVGCYRRWIENPAGG